MEEIEIPHYFLCPISLQIMKDPVTLPTGITYDRENIDKWVFSNNHRFCPATKQPLPAHLLDDGLFTPNHTLRRLIQSWCVINASAVDGIERFPTPKPALTKPQITKLLADHSKSTTPAKIKCLARLRSIAAASDANKRCIEAAGGALFAASLIMAADESADANATHEALSTLHSLNLSEPGLKTLLLNNNTGSYNFFVALTRTLKLGISDDSRVYAVMMLKSITQLVLETDSSSSDSSSSLTHLMITPGLTPEFFAQIVQLLKDEITPKATRAGLHVLRSVISMARNRSRLAVEAGAIPVLIDMLLESTSSEQKRVCEMALAVLDQLCQCAEGRAEVVGNGAGLAIVSKKMLRVSKVATESATRVLHSIAKHSGSPRVLKEMVETGVVSKLCLVLQTETQGSSRTKERVREILKMHARSWKDSHCIPMAILSSYLS